MSVAIDGVTVRSRALTAAIKRRREASGLSGRALSQKLGLSHGTISHWETGRRVPAPEDVASLLTAMGVVGKEREDVLNLARRAAEPNWLAVSAPGLPQQLVRAVECERAATDIIDWSLTVVPGLLQTGDYSLALAHASGMADAKVEQLAIVRAGRREVLLRRVSPVQYTAIVAETALRERVAQQRVLTEQLRFLNEMGARDNVVLRVVPSHIGWHPGLVGPFVLYDFPDGPTVVHCEHYSFGAFVREPHDVQVYRGAVDTLSEQGMSSLESAQFIAQLAEEMEHER
ncbi:MAG: helix-turn-helix domain-containing protein [Sciscionella sp.]